MKTYFIHDNGCRPFKVIIDTSDNQNKIIVYQLIRNSPGGENDYNTENPVLESLFEQIFIGESNSNKTTRYSGGHGPNFKGNTVLFKRGHPTKEIIRLNASISRLPHGNFCNSNI